MAEKDEKTALEVGADLAKEIVKPFYEDAAQPAARELGKAGHLAGRLLNVALGPVELAVLTGEGVLDLARKKIASKLAGMAESELQNPDPLVALPALEGVRRAANHDDLQEMFLNLIASASKKSEPQVHPRFVDVISKLSPPEASLFQSLGTRAEPIVWIEITVRYGMADPIAVFSFTPLEVAQAIPVPDLTDGLVDAGLIRILASSVEGTINGNTVSLFHEDHNFREWRPQFKHTIVKAVAPQLQYATGGRYEGKVRTARLTPFGYDLYRAAVALPAGTRPRSWAD